MFCAIIIIIACLWIYECRYPVKYVIKLFKIIKWLMITYNTSLTTIFKWTINNWSCSLIPICYFILPRSRLINNIDNNVLIMTI